MYQQKFFIQRPTLSNDFPWRDSLLFMRYVPLFRTFFLQQENSGSRIFTCLKNMLERLPTG